MAYTKIGQVYTIMYKWKKYLKTYKCPACKKYHIACKNKFTKIIWLLNQIKGII